MLCAPALGACDGLFGLTHVSAGPDDASHSDAHDAKGVDAAIDAPRDASGRQLCPGNVAAIFDEPFNTATPANACKPWGSAYHDTGVTVTQTGELTITADSAAAAVGGCTMNSATNLGTSVTVVVNAVVTGGTGYNVFELHNIDYQIKQAGGLLRFQDAASNDYGTVTYDSTIKYWRLRQVGGTSLIAEYSTDNNSYAFLGSRTLSVPAMGTIELAVGTNTIGGQGAAKFDELFICP